MATEEPIYRSRPGADAISPASAERAEEVAPGHLVSPGLSNSYLLTTVDGRVVRQHRHGLRRPGPPDRTSTRSTPSPVRYVLLTQGHYDHVGGVDAVRDPGLEVVAQANWRQWRDDNERLETFRAATQRLRVLRHGSPTASPRSSSAVSAASCRRRARARPPTIDVRRHARARPSAAAGSSCSRRPAARPPTRWWSGSPTSGSASAATCSARCSATSRTWSRCAATATATRSPSSTSIERVRALRPEVLLTGHFDPIARRRPHRRRADPAARRGAVRPRRDGRRDERRHDVHTLMRRDHAARRISRSARATARSSWDVRAIWENYAGWFHHRSTTELYAVARRRRSAPTSSTRPAPTAPRPGERPARGRRDRCTAIHLTELVPTPSPRHAGARAVMLKAAHEDLLGRQRRTSGRPPGCPSRSEATDDRARHLRLHRHPGARHRRHQRHRPRHRRRCSATPAPR